ncbi:MAG: hypothetical protein ACRC10_07690 [Thermoguttaceae bacterium]
MLFYQVRDKPTPIGPIIWLFCTLPVLQRRDFSNQHQNHRELKGTGTLATGLIITGFPQKNSHHKNDCFIMEYFRSPS